MDAAAGADEQARKELRQLVRAALLCQLSGRKYFPDGRPLKERVTASTLLRLNETDVRSLTELTGINKVAQRFRDLSAVAPEVQVTADGQDVIVHVRIERVDFDRPLRRARAEVRHEHRFAYMRRLLVEQLGLDLGTGNEGSARLTWRGTKRVGKVRLANVRTLSYAGRDNEFDPGGNDFLLLVDYPFDEEAGRSRQDDIERVAAARSRGTQWTLAWLPVHLTPSEMESLDNATAVELIRKDKRRYLEDYAPRDAEQAAKALAGFQISRRQDLELAVRRVYFEEGQIHALRGPLDGVSLLGMDRGRAVAALGAHVLDKRYPNHPAFTRKVGTAELTRVIDWVVRAAQTGQAVELSSVDMGIVDAVAVPLELVHKGASSITPRKDGRYLREVLGWVGDKRRFEAGELRGPLMAEDGWSFGLSRPVADLFLYYLLQVEGFEAHVGDRSTTVDGLARLPERFRLVKDDVVDAPTWEKAHQVAQDVLGVTGRVDLPSSPEQAKLSRDAAAKGISVRARVRELENKLRSAFAWAGASKADSGRYRTVEALNGWLDQVLGDLSNAGRARRLADGAEQAAAWKQVVGGLDAELAALSKLDGARLAFKTVKAQGDEQDQTKSVRRLVNLLEDPVKRKLSDHAAALVEAVERRAEDLLRGDVIAREEVMAFVTEEARRKLEASPAKAFRVTVLVDPVE